MAYVNYYIIYCQNRIAKNEKPACRKNNVKKFSYELSLPWMKKKLAAIGIYDKI